MYICPDIACTSNDIDIFYRTLGPVESAMFYSVVFPICENSNVHIYSVRKLSRNMKKNIPSDMFAQEGLDQPAHVFSVYFPVVAKI